MAGILARCRGVARHSPEAERHTVAGIGVATIGVATIGVATIGVATIGVVAIGAITITIMTSSSSAASAFRTGARGWDIHMDITAMATHTDTTMAMVTPTGMIITAGPLTDTGTAIKGTATAAKGTATAAKDTAMAIDRGSRSCRGALRGLATTAAPLMESWDHKPGAPFALTNVRMVN